MSSPDFTPQPFLEPPGYFESPASEPAWVAYTKPRAEKKLARFLAAEAVAHYLPTLQSRRAYGSSVRTSWVPLFPGYLFILRPDVVRRRLYRSEAIVDFLPVKQPAQLFADLRAFWLALTRTPDTVREAKLQPGQAVEVIAGPLKGVEGTLVTSKEGTRRLLLAIRLLGRAITLDIDQAYVRRV